MKKPTDLEVITKILMPDEAHPSDFESLHGFVLCGYAEKTVMFFMPNLSRL